MPSTPRFHSKVTHDDVAQTNEQWYRTYPKMDPNYPTGRTWQNHGTIRTSTRGLRHLLCPFRSALSLPSPAHLQLQPQDGDIWQLPTSCPWWKTHVVIYFTAKMFCTVNGHCPPPWQDSPWVRVEILPGCEHVLVKPRGYLPCIPLFGTNSYQFMSACCSVHDSRRKHDMPGDLHIELTHLEPPQIVIGTCSPHI
jgi:hypothetical protein